MLADETVVIRRGWVAIGTAIFERTVSLQMRLAYWSIWIDSEAVFATQEVGEVEAVVLL
jgi:phosphoglycerate dehydrogenase-like enzyme